MHPAHRMRLVIAGMQRLDMRRNMRTARRNIREILWHHQTKPDRSASAGTHFNRIVEECSATAAVSSVVLASAVFMVVNPFCAWLAHDD